MRKTSILAIASLATSFMLIICFTGTTFAATSDVATPNTSYSYYTPSLTNNGAPGWAYFTDANGVYSAYTNSNGSTYTSQAVWNFSQLGGCNFYVYVPAGNATANISYGFFQPGFAGVGETKVGATAVNQNNVSGWVWLGAWSGINQVQFSNNDGQYGTNIGVGVNNSLEAVC